MTFDPLIFWIVTQVTIVLLAVILIPVPKRNSSFNLRDPMTVQQLALLYQILETKNSWGKNEVKSLILEVATGIRTEV